MTLACHHVPRETGTAFQPTCRHCGVLIGQAKCNACYGTGCWNGNGRWNSPIRGDDVCMICDGQGFHWVQVTTILPTPANRGEG
jgi:hypothetical protein